MQRQGMISRLGIHTVIALVCGAMTVFPYCWILGLLASHTDESTYEITNGETKRKIVCIEGTTIQTYATMSLNADSNFQFGTGQGQAHLLPESIPKWANVSTSSPSAEEATRQRMQLSIGVGWPVVALRSSFVIEGNRIVERTPVLPWPSSAQTIRTLPPRHFQVVPVWPGYIQTALALAIIWPLILTALWGFDVAIRWNRRRRGVCEKCKYPVRALHLCPECGIPSSRPVSHQIGRNQ